MSFMFHPHPYSDPRAVNPIPTPAGAMEEMTVGLLQVAKRIGAAIRGGALRIGLDGYPGAQFSVLVNAIAQQFEPGAIALVDARSLLLKAEMLESKIAPCLPNDIEADPVLLYGVRFMEGYAGLQDESAVRCFMQALESAKVPTLVYGLGALSEGLVAAYDLRIWMDITPKQAVLNFKNGLAVNMGCEAALPYNEMMRRNYYIDFEVAIENRWALIRQGKIDWYITASDPLRMILLPFETLGRIFDEVNHRPFRCRPVYLEGVWGGYYIKRLRNLPADMRNCAWVFDMIPMEVSLAILLEGTEVEVPFFTFVMIQGEKLLGKKAYEAFGGYFPIRFNYDDTYHSSGNMSIQCHPGAAYVTKNHGELGRQDESYYVCLTGQGAATYLGFQEENSCEAFLALADKAQSTGELVDYQKYVYAVESKPGTQVMIPAGTIHASGQNQVILEIGSLTVGSYTYKLYDYQRLDPITEKPRPIHLKMGRENLYPERTKEWVLENVLNHGYVVRHGHGFEEVVVGEHDLLYFSLRNLRFLSEMEDDTAGVFHVLALVDGERVRVESMENPGYSYTLTSMDIAVIPANLGRYRLVNEGVGPVVVHKTLLKETLI